MGLETSTTISGLNQSFPIGATDLINQGDDHIRLLKAVLRATFLKANGSPWSTFIQVDEVDVQNGHVPLGGIIMWGGTIASIPTNWQLCDGTNGTPDLRNKFIIGADADVSGVAKTSITGSATQTGGSKDSIVVSHTHTGTATSVVTDPGHRHPHKVGSVSGGTLDSIFTTNNAGGTVTIVQSATTGITVATTLVNDPTGSSGTNANLNPYYALAYIKRIS